MRDDDDKGKGELDLARNDLIASRQQQSAANSNEKIETLRKTKTALIDDIAKKKRKANSFPIDQKGISPLHTIDEEFYEIAGSTLEGMEPEEQIKELERQIKELELMIARDPIRLLLDLRQSNNPAITEIRQPNGEILINSIENEGADRQLPVFIRDFSAGSLSFEGKKFLEFKGAWPKGLKGKETDKTFFETNQAVIIAHLNANYLNSRLRKVAGVLPELQEVKRIMENPEDNLDRIKDFWKNYLALLVFSSAIDKKFPDDEQYCAVFEKLWGHSTQAVPTFLKNIHEKFWNGEFFLQRPNEVMRKFEGKGSSCDIVIKENGAIHILAENKSCLIKVESSQQKVKKVKRSEVDQPKAEEKAAEEDLSRDFGSLSCEFIVEKDFLKLKKLETQDPVQLHIINGGSAEDGAFGRYLDGGSARNLRIEIDPEIKEYIKIREELFEAAKHDYQNELFLDLKTNLKPAAKKLIAESDQVVFDKATPDRSEVQKLTSHLKSLSACFAAEDAKEMIGAIGAFNKSTELLKEVPVSDDGEKRMGDSGSLLGRVLAVSLGIVGILSGVVGLALCLTVVGSPWGAGLIVGSIFATTTAAHVYNGYTATGVMKASHSVETLFKKAAVQELEEVVVEGEALAAN